MFLGFIACPPLWIVFTLPLWHNYSKVPIIKFMSYLTSHVYLMLLLQMVAITPYYKAARQNLFPYWYEWLLLVSRREQSYTNCKHFYVSINLLGLVEWFASV